MSYRWGERGGVRERERESQGVRERGRERRDNEGSIISRRGKGNIERDRKKETEIENVRVKFK